MLIYRFSSSVVVTHINIKMAIQPGSAATLGPVIRFTLFRAAQGTAFAANLQGSYNPVVTSAVSRLYWDHYYVTPATLATGGFPLTVHKSIKLKHQQKFSGAAAGTTTGDSLFLIIQSSAGAGTGAPVLTGVVEVYFQPT